MGGIGFSTAGVTDSCKSLSGSWEPNWGPLEEQGVLLTAEPSSLQPHIQFLSWENTGVYEEVWRKSFRERRWPG